MKARSYVVLSCLFLLLPVVPGQAAAQTPDIEVRARITGYLLKVHCQEGAAVKKGDLLFEIDAAPYLAQLSRADAKIALAAAQLAVQKRTLEGTKKLLETKVVGRGEYEGVAGQVAVAQAQRAVAQVDRDIAAIPVAAAKVYAPVDGTITRLLIVAGNLVKADDTLLAVLQPPGAQKKPAGDADKIKELLKERRDVLQIAADQLKVRFENGQIPGREVMRAQKAALEAALDLAETPAERIDGLRKILTAVERINAEVEAHVKAGKAPASEALQARAVVLEIRIRLLREEQKAKMPK